MSDDWLQHGHGIHGVELSTVLSSSSLLAEHAVAPSRRLTWRAGVTGGAIALLAMFGVVGVANALGDNLFPSLGPTSPASVWQNPVPATEPEPADDTATTSVPTTTVPTTTATVPTTTPAAKAVSPGTAPALSPTTSTPKRDSGDDDVPVTTAHSPTADHGSDDSGDVEGDGSSGSSGSSGSGSSRSGSGGSGGAD